MGEGSFFPKKIAIPLSREAPLKGVLNILPQKYVKILA